MPHKRTKKNFQKTRLQFEVESSFLFLKVFRVTPGLITVPIETLTVLFTLKFSRISNLQICLTETKLSEEDDCENPPTFSLRADNLGLKVTTVKTRDAPLEVAMCQLPAWYLPAQRTTIGGVCSVVRYALKMAISTGEAENLFISGLFWHTFGICLHELRRLDTARNSFELDDNVLNA